MFDDREYENKLGYFRRGAADNGKFWQRLGGRPPLVGTRALDLGCGLGSLCVDLAEAHCQQVIGLDINERAIS